VQSTRIPRHNLGMRKPNKIKNLALNLLTTSSHARWHAKWLIEDMTFVHVSFCKITWQILLS